MSLTVTSLPTPIFHQQVDIASLFEAPLAADRNGAPRAGGGRRLTLHAAPDLEVTLDVLAEGAASCCFARLIPGRVRQISVALKGAYRLTTCASGGWLLLPAGDDFDHYWLPQAPRLRRLDDCGHVLEERDIEFDGVTVSSTELALQATTIDGWAMDWIMWRFSRPASDFPSELRDLLSVEKQRHFLWGSHTIYQCPADVYLHLIHGHVYETRFSWPKHWKICSENDAHALYTILSGLEAASGKRLYRLLKDQLLLSVLARQSEDGGWRHGEWSDRMESHYRLHCSAMHMLMDALAQEDDPAVRTALERAARFLSLQTDKLNAGTWFLHDELEHSVEAVRQGPFRWLPSRALGKSEANMLVLNSHLDATVALDRYGEVTGDARHQSLVARAVSATRAVLALRPAEWLYRPLFRAINLTFLPTDEAKRLPLYLRALKRLAWKYLIPLVPLIKARYPRIVMPGGYVDRELSLRIFAYEYLPINLMDLLRYRRRFPNEAVDDVIHAAIALVRDCRMLERWPEIKGNEYAAGFWAEALYQACLAYPDAGYRIAMAQAVIALEESGLGLPPSLLGANSEAVPRPEQAPTPVPGDARIRVVNLSRRGAIEVLLVNCATEPVRLRVVRHAPEDLAWAVGMDADRADGLPAEIPGGGWVWGHTPNRTGAAA